ncbi:serine protease inhibitor Cvsi-2-like isoform X2 [Crassostrea virginica]
MKVIVSISVFCLVAAFVAGEKCASPGDCMLETCSDGAFLDCVQGLCTCLRQRRCRGLRDCYGLPACPGDESWHCFDNVCKCLDI